MPRGVPKSASATSVPSASTRSMSARSAKIKANMSLMDHADADYDALIRKHDKKGARGFTKTRETGAGTKARGGEASLPAGAAAAATKIRTPMSPSTHINQDTTMAMPTDDTDKVVEAKVKTTTANRRTKKSAKMTSDTEEHIAEHDAAPTESTLRQEDEADAVAGDEMPEAESKRSKKTATSAKKTTSSRTTKSKSAPRSKSKPAGKSTAKAASAALEMASSETPGADVLGEAKAAENHNTINQAPTTPDKGKGRLVEDEQSGAENHELKKKSRKGNHSPRKAPATRVGSSSALPVAMPEMQIHSFLANYDLEAENRIRIAKKTLQISIDSARTQMHAKAIAKLPRSVRLMKLSDFVHEYGANVQAALERAAVAANRVREGEWEEEKLQRKRKGDAHEDGDENQDELTRRRDKNAKLDARKGQLTTVSASASKRVKDKITSSSATRRVAAPSKVPILSPSRQENAIRPPTATLFAPRLGHAAQSASDTQTSLVTPARGPARAARTGEQVQYLSLNGSPIIGVIAPDGTVHPMPKANGSPSKPKDKQMPFALLEDEQDAAETSAHLLELAVGIDGDQGKQARLPKAPSESPVSHSSMHTAPGTTRTTIETESDDGGDVFEEAVSLPEDDAGSLPDEEAYTAQILREETARRERARSSAVVGGGRSSSSLSNGSISSSGLIGTTSARNSASTIRPDLIGRNGSTLLGKGNSGHKTAPLGSSSPMIKRKISSKGSEASERGWGPQHTMSGSSSMSSGPSQSSSSPSKGRVSIVFGSGSHQRITHLGVEDLMRLPSHERTQMLEILEKLRRSQLASAD